MKCGISAEEKLESLWTRVGLFSAPSVTHDGSCCCSCYPGTSLKFKSSLFFLQAFSSVVDAQAVTEPYWCSCCPARGVWQLPRGVDVGWVHLAPQGSSCSCVTHCFLLGSYPVLLLHLPWNRCFFANNCQMFILWSSVDIGTYLGKNSYLQCCVCSFTCSWQTWRQNCIDHIFPTVSSINHDVMPMVLIIFYIAVAFIRC